MKNNLKLLAIETSCDETAAAVLETNHSFKRHAEFISASKNKSSKQIPKQIRDDGGSWPTGDTRYAIYYKPLSNVVASQIKIHQKYGGVYPELASRAHLEKIIPVIRQSLRSAKLDDDLSQLKNNVDALAVTAGPGLIGSLLVGVQAAKTLAATTGLPLYPINHLEGHIYINFVDEQCHSEPAISAGEESPEDPSVALLPRDDSGLGGDKRYAICDMRFPILALIASGGHTSLILMRDHLQYQIIGQTLDDAAGEAFDKVAKLLGLGYPGGPAIDKLARDGNPRAFDFPRSMARSGDFNFSFSGLKTAVLYKTQNLKRKTQNHNPKVKSSTYYSSTRKPEGHSGGEDTNWFSTPLRSARTIKLPPKQIADLAASFQEAVCDILVQKTIAAARKYQAKTIVLGGGVAANSRLRQMMQNAISPDAPAGIPTPSRRDDKRYAISDMRYAIRDKRYAICLPPAALATDNALGIAIAAAYHLVLKKPTVWQKVDADANMKIG